MIAEAWTWVALFPIPLGIAGAVWFIRDMRKKNRRLSRIRDLEDASHDARH